MQFQKIAVSKALKSLISENSMVLFKINNIFDLNLANKFMHKVNNRNARKRREICSKLTKRPQNNIIDVALVSSLLTLNIFHTFF